MFYYKKKEKRWRSSCLNLSRSYSRTNSPLSPILRSVGAMIGKGETRSRLVIVGLYPIVVFDLSTG